MLRTNSEASELANRPGTLFNPSALIADADAVIACC